VNLVLDASMAASWCFPDERTDLTQRLLNDLAGPAAAAAPRMGLTKFVMSSFAAYDRIGLGTAMRKHFSNHSQRSESVYSTHHTLQSFRLPYGTI
jgi:hypothetical protein